MRITDFENQILKSVAETSKSTTTIIYTVPATKAAAIHSVSISARDGSPKTVSVAVYDELGAFVCNLLSCTVDGAGNNSIAFHVPVLLTSQYSLKFTGAASIANAEIFGEEFIK